MINVCVSESGTRRRWPLRSQSLMFGNEPERVAPLRWTEQLLEVGNSGRKSPAGRRLRLCRQLQGRWHQDSWNVILKKKSDAGWNSSIISEAILQRGIYNFWVQKSGFFRCSANLPPQPATSRCRGGHRLLLSLFLFFPFPFNCFWVFDAPVCCLFLPLLSGLRQLSSSCLRIGSDHDVVRSAAKAR